MKYKVQVHTTYTYIKQYILLTSTSISYQFVIVRTTIEGTPPRSIIVETCRVLPNNGIFGNLLPSFANKYCEHFTIPTVRRPLKLWGHADLVTIDAKAVRIAPEDGGFLAAIGNLFENLFRVLTRSNRFKCHGNCY